MLETYFSVTKMLGRLRSGPSGPYLDGFAAALKRQGYSPATAVRYLRAAAHLGHVMAEHGLANIDVAAFGDHLRTCRCSRASGGRRNHHTIFGARLFRQYLVDIGVCRPAATPTEPAEPQLVASFKVWLRKHRGAAAPTIKLYARDAVLLVTELGADPTSWKPADVRSYFLDRASRCGSGTVEKLTTSLRAFLRYLAVEGRWQAGLDGVVPAYAHWRLADMPRYLSAEQVSRLIAACDGETIACRRDRAIVLLLARAGLKIAALSQFQLVLSDKQPGAASKIVCLPGSAEGGGQVGVGAKGYTADLLILEEAAFLDDGVIGAVLPSIAARPKAQLVGISSAGIIGTFFHDQPAVALGEDRGAGVAVWPIQPGAARPSQVDAWRAAVPYGNGGPVGVDRR